MGVLKRVRDLWRFDGDEDPGTVSRRSFIFLTGVAVAGSFLPELETQAPARALPQVGDAVHMGGYGPTLYVTSVDHTLGIVTFDTTPPVVFGIPYHHSEGNVQWMGLDRKAVAPRPAPRSFADLRPYDMLGPQDISRFRAIDARDYPEESRYLLHAAWSQPGIVQSIEVSKRRLLRAFPNRDQRRPGGKFRA